MKQANLLDVNSFWWSSSICGPMALQVSLNSWW